MRAVEPRLDTRAGSAPVFNNRRTILGWPPAAAVINGVTPDVSTPSISHPLRINTKVVRHCPLEQAHINAVHPSRSRLSRGAPAITSSSTTSSLPAAAARISGVADSPSRMSGSAPPSRSRLICPTWPAKEHRWRAESHRSSRRFTSAPKCSRTPTTAGYPRRFRMAPRSVSLSVSGHRLSAVHDRAVPPERSVRFGSAPASRRISTRSGQPHPAAAINAVDTSSSVGWSRSAPAARWSRTLPMSPASTAARRDTASSSEHTDPTIGDASLTMVSKPTKITDLLTGRFHNERAGHDARPRYFFSKIRSGVTRRLWTAAPQAPAAPS